MGVPWIQLEGLKFFCGIYVSIANNMLQRYSIL
jgi:hypothetical protein